MAKTEFFLMISVQYHEEDYETVMTKKIYTWGISVDPVLNSLNQHHETCMADSKENYG